MPKSKIYFRADGNSKIGLGHVIRSLALADMLNTQFDCHFIIRNPLLTIQKQILEVCNSCISLLDTENDIEEADRIADIFLTGNEIVVLDGYNFSTTYQKILKNKGCKLVCIDDIITYHFMADVVINHAGGIDENQYSVEAYTQVYLGLKYALLRRPFLKAAQKKESFTPNKNIFICFGGADPKNDTLAALKKCEETDTIEKCFLVIGGAYKHQETLSSFIQKSSLDIEVLHNLDASQMVHYMKKCSMAITSPSTISFEYLSVGGILFLKMTADNQLNINKYFLKEKLAFPFHSFPSISENLLKSSLKNQAQQFDGLTAQRFIKIFQSI